jgi:transposase
MKLYAGIDLHSNNNQLAILDQNLQAVLDQRLPNRSEAILKVLEPHRVGLQGLVVESTFNWYWLVDDLMDAGYKMHLANTTAIQQYSGMKHADDKTDARWLAKMLQMGILPEGYIYPKKDRPIRDLMRKRGQLVRQRTMQILNVQTLICRNTGKGISASTIHGKDRNWIRDSLSNPEKIMAIDASIAIIDTFTKQIKRLEKAILGHIKPDPLFDLLQTVVGIGPILALTIFLEVGDIRRFDKVGQYASYCRCVSSQRLSNGKKKGKGNRKNGNRYLSWAYAEAATFGIRYCPSINRFYQRKKKRTKVNCALKAVSHKLARATYFMMRDQVPFDKDRTFG